MQRPITKSVQVLVTSALFISLTLGCQSVNDSVPPHSTDDVLSGQKEVSNSIQDSPHSKSEKTAIASSSKDASSDAANQNHPEFDFDRKNMKLKGISLSDTEQDITKAWGAPDTRYTMDEADPIEVLEYEGYSFGCNSKGHVAFIEVSGSGTSTGIIGLKVGDHDSSAVTALGKPDQDTGYVWSYKSGNALLRLDLDPKTSKIQSVKLFPHQSSAA
ncbi:DNA uptake lipoprotein [Paenibacillus sp. ACRRX]|uniref:DNA uptake lipoprotein n=1 Tax=Paenibacillus sp. ACRRX TaxID=2918206 RepID=UPI001EF704A1|nr:DNA uptake lipoprotein [Paenibacillus sp. ACRRX]MCG7406082.1 DNA uptake lipoprotein [Paenibacillus sp. ACRRX]